MNNPNQLRVCLVLIHQHYAGKTAERSKQPCMKHITQGLDILATLGADETTQAAFCLHPLMQRDDMLLKFDATGIDPHIIILAMEYRARANAYLPKDYNILDTPELKLGPLFQVKQMLIADKVQNYSDFKKFNQGTSNASELRMYFHTWFVNLNLSRVDIDNLLAVIR